VTEVTWLMVFDPLLAKKNQKKSPRHASAEIMENFWNNRYEKQPLLYGKAPNVFFATQLSILPCGKILLPGEGEGRNALYAASRGWEVTAYDPSHVAREHALLEAEKLGLSINYLTCDAEKFIPEPASYDAVGLIYIHLAEASLLELQRRAVMALKPGGKLILEGFGKNQF
jgi:2-polyprenyl-3-methyl-5-hydroxy-6-metoxy-1,4-benzoquinol methylase